jgi:preprotein translocase subunit SecY
VVGKVEVGLGLASLALGVVALVLAVFMGSILVVWAAELMDHAGILPGADHRSGLRYP